MSHTIISKRTFFTGKTINVSIGLARLGVQSFVTGFMYEDNGKLFEQELHKEGVEYKFIWNKGRVRENYKFVDYKSMMTEVNDVSSPVSPEGQQELIDMVADLAKSSEAVVVAGGLAKDMTADYYGKILSSIPQGVKKIVDTEGERLFESLKVGVDLVKPNLDELQRTLDVKIKTRQNAIDACKMLIDKGAKIVLLSLGKRGAIITDGKDSYYCKSINVAMNSTVGAGDAMVAAVTMALIQGADLQEILRCGVAAGTAAVTSPDSISFKKVKYDEIYNSLKVITI
jgi:1-phosphofructokinase